MPRIEGSPRTIAQARAPLDGGLLDGTAYRLIAPIGEGGMGEVFLAEHRALGHRVVVKVLREQFAGRKEMHDRMRVEAQALARIRHPNLVMVTDFGKARGGRPFLVMERLAGRSLRGALDARPVLPVADAVEIARQMLLGLAAVHGAGLVHRDIKPDNVFLCEDEAGKLSVKILDFGVVKIVQAGRDPRTPAPLADPTGEGIVLGTPRYFSPEQARGVRDLDARSDLYAVGLVLYTMLTGRGPFDHHLYLQEVLKAHAAEAPLSVARGSPQPIPAAVERVVMRALAKAREERFADAMAFAEELSAAAFFLGPVSLSAGAAPAAPLPGRLAPVEVTAPVGAALLSPEDPTITASPAGKPAAEGAPRKLSDHPVIMDGLVERVLGGRALGRPPLASPASAGLPSTLPMVEVTLPVMPAPPLNAAVVPVAAAARPALASVTLPMVPMLPLRRPPPAAWRGPVLVGAAALIVALMISAALLLSR